MSIDERDRLALHEAARQTWGPEIAVTLMEMLPPGGWAEVATKSDVALLRSDLAVASGDLRGETAGLGVGLRTEMAELRTDMVELRTELRTEMAELRTELRTDMAELRTELRTEMADVRVEMANLGTTVERSLRTSLMWTITTLVAGFGGVAAVTALAR